jgi:predicted nucleotidyltransferase
VAGIASPVHHTWRRVEETLKSALRTAVNAVATALSALPVPGMIIGGIAVIARGVPRLTRDVDATVAGGVVDLADLVRRLVAHELVPRIDDAMAFAEANQVLLLRHEPTRVDVDLSIAWLPFELEALAAAQPLEIAGTRVPVARAEDLIIYKAVAFRPQDVQDIERLLILYGSSIDLARIQRIVGEFAAALDEPRRLQELDDIVRRVGLA